MAGRISESVRGRSFSRLLFTLRFAFEFRRVDSEQDVQSEALEFNLLQALSLNDVVEADVSSSLFLFESVLDPQDVFLELGLSYTRKSHPNPSFVERQNSAAPPQQGVLLMANSMNFVKIHDLLDRKVVPVRNYDSSIDGGEIDAVAPYQAVMRPLYLNVDTPPGSGQANGVLLRKSRYPYLFPELEHAIGMRLMGLGAVHLAIINIP
jgi:hypothetical protein